MIVRPAILAACAVGLVLATGLPVIASEPASHDVVTPSSPGQRVRVEWTGVIPPGANTTSSCVDAPLDDRHTINLTVPDGAYEGLIVSATFTLAPLETADAIITVVAPDGAALNNDGGFVGGSEVVKLVNPRAGTYEIRACAFAGTGTYTGSLDLFAALPGECPPDTLAGLDLQTVTIPQLQGALEAGTLTSRALVETYVKRIATYDRAGPELTSIREVNASALDAAAALDAERKASGARGPMHGIPVLLKDNVGTLDMPTTAGSIALEGSVPLHEAFLVSQLRRAGAIILGKANLSEFANWVDPQMPSGYSSLGGQVLNPYHFGDPSGSSSGSGVATAMALSTTSIGTETSGSILSPSIANSVVGIKPTVGLVSRAGVIPLASTFDTAGPMTRSVTDAAIMLGIIAGSDPRDPKTSENAGKIPPNSDYRPFLRADGLSGARIGVSDADRDGLGEEQLALFDEVLATLERLGATLVHSDDLSNGRNAGLTEIGAIPNEFKYYLNKYLAEETVPTLRVRTLNDIMKYNSEHPDKVKYGQKWITISDATLGNVDEPTAVANRTLAVDGSRVVIDKAMADGDVDAFVAPGAVNANIGAAALYPSIAVPAGYTVDGTQPFGITFLGSAYSEASLIQFAYAYEQGATRRRIRPTAVNPGLCPPRAAVVGTRRTATTVKGSRRTLPATGVEADVPAALLCLVAAFGAGRRAKSRP